MSQQEIELDTMEGNSDVDTDGNDKYRNGFALDSNMDKYKKNKKWVNLQRKIITCVYNHPRTIFLALIFLIVCCLAMIITLAVVLSTKDGSEVSTPPEYETYPNREILYQEMYDAIDFNIDPCEDFYEYSCGNWLRNTDIPADKSGWSRSFSKITALNEQVYLDILDNGTWPVLSPLYKSCLNLDIVNTLQFDPLKQYIEDISTVSDLSSAFELAGRFITTLPLETSLFFGMYVDVDRHDPGHQILYFTQGGLGLPDPSYYLAVDDENSTFYSAIRFEYQQHIKTMLLSIPDTMAIHYNEEDIDERVSLLYQLEEQLAHISQNSTFLRNSEITFNVFTGDYIDTHFFPLQDFLRGCSSSMLPSLLLSFYTRINLDSLLYFNSFVDVFEMHSNVTVQDYLLWNVLSVSSPYLHESIASQRFAFTGEILRGQKEQPTREKFCVDVVLGSVGQLLSHYFIYESFDDNAKKAAQQLTTNIISSFYTILDNVEWMDDATKDAAFLKLDRMTAQIGYPDDPLNWIDYSSLAPNLSISSFFSNIVTSLAFNSRRNLMSINGVVNKGEWLMLPSTVNAYNDFSRNQIVFPAGILQSTFFSVEQPVTMNYAGIAMVQGHEISHSFDDQGSHYVASGNMTNWFTTFSARRFEEDSLCLVDQYNEYSVDDLHVNGELTLGENIADLGGLAAAWVAYEIATQKYGTYTPPSPLRFLKPNQFFFVAFAQNWCEVRTEESIRMRLLTDPHSPPHYRVVGTLSNFKPFATAFGCSQNSKMINKNPCSIWDYE